MNSIIITLKINMVTTQKYFDYSNKLVIEKMNDETRGVAIEEFVEAKNAFKFIK